MVIIVFAESIRQFSDNLEALRDFVEEVAPVLKEKLAECTEKDAKSLFPLVFLLTEAFPENSALKLDEEGKQRLRDRYKDKITIEKTHSEETGLKVSMNVHGKLGDDFDKALKRFSRSTHRQELLYKNSLIALISSVEWFLSQLLHEYFQKYPDAVGSRDKTFSLDDLRSLGTIEEAQHLLIDSRVEEVLRGSFSDWIDFLKNRLKLSLGYLEPHNEQMIEITQRRNLLVHNGGIVNSIYISKVPEHLRNDLKVGQLITISEEYLEKAIRVFERVFVLISLELWKKLLPNDEARFDVISDIAWKHLLAERWDLAEGFSYFIMQDKQLSELSQVIGMFNYWQALKWQGRFDEIRDEIDKADFSAKQKKFELAQIALLDKEDEFFELLPKALESGEITETDLKEWPIFRGMRETTTYQELYEKVNSESAQKKEDSDSAKQLNA